MLQSISGHSSEQSIANHSSQPTLYQSDLRMANHRRQKFPLSLTFHSFKTQIKWPLGWLQPQVFREYFLNSCNIQGNVQAFWFTGLLWHDKNWLQLTYASIFFKICRRFCSSILLLLLVFDAWVRFDSGMIFLDQSQFFTHA